MHRPRKDSPMPVALLFAASPLLHGCLLFLGGRTGDDSNDDTGATLETGPRDTADTREDTGERLDTGDTTDTTDTTDTEDPLDPIVIAEAEFGDTSLPYYLVEGDVAYVLDDTAQTIWAVPLPDGPKVAVVTDTILADLDTIFAVGAGRVFYETPEHELRAFTLPSGPAVPIATLAGPDTRGPYYHDGYVYYGDSAGWRRRDAENDAATEEAWALDGTVPEFVEDRVYFATPANEVAYAPIATPTAVTPLTVAEVDQPIWLIHVDGTRAWYCRNGALWRVPLDGSPNDEWRQTLNAVDAACLTRLTFLPDGETLYAPNTNLFGASAFDVSSGGSITQIARGAIIAPWHLDTDYIYLMQVDTFATPNEARLSRVPRPDLAP